MARDRPEADGRHPALGVLPMLWNRLDELSSDDPESALLRRLAKLTEAAGIEVELAREWSLVRAVETVVWNAEIGMVQEEHRPGWIADTLLRS